MLTVAQHSKLDKMDEGCKVVDFDLAWGRDQTVLHVPIIRKPDGKLVKLTPGGRLTRA